MSVRRLGKHVSGPLVGLCALIVVFWAGSYRSISHLKLPVSAGSTRWELTSYRGILTVALIANHPTSQSAVVSVRRDFSELAAAWDEQYWTAAFAGFSVEDSHIMLGQIDGESVVRRWSAMHLPYWAMFLLGAMGPMHGVYIVLRAHRRTTHGQCADCGYELGGGPVCQACAARSLLIGASPRVQLVR